MLILLIACIIAGYRFMSPRFGKALLASLVLVFDAFLLTSLIEGRYGTQTEEPLGDYATLIWIMLSLFLSVVAFALGFVINYKITDGERARKVFFNIVLFIFILAGIVFVWNAIDGMVVGYETRLPGNICYQMSYGFPLVYFMRDKYRKWVLQYFCCVTIWGGATTMITELFADGLDWKSFHATIVHITMVLVPIMVVLTGQYRSNYIDLVTGTGFYGGTILVAYICNLIVWAQGSTGNYLAYGVPFIGSAWVVLLISYFICIAMGAGLCWYGLIKKQKTSGEIV